MLDRRFLALLALVFSWPTTARAQIITLEKVGDKTVACSRSGLTSSFKDCGVRADWYTYVFVGVISGVTPVENDEKQIELVPEEVFFGTPATALTVLTAQADCMREFKVGDRWLFYLRKVEGEPLVLDYYANDSLPVADAQNQIVTLRRLEKIGNVAILRGQVVRGELFSGEVVPNAQITATRQPDGRQSFCVTDTDGRYEFPPLPPGKYKITVQPVGSYQPDDSEVHLTSGTCRDITLYRSPHAKIGGHVRRSDGTPAANVALVLVRSDNSSFVTTQTDPEGYFVFDSQEPGEYVLGLNSPASPDWFDGGGFGDGVRIPPASMFYPAVADRSSAMVIRLATDERLERFDFIVPSR
jgi:Carboxypeptidase regulatory-like domain